MSIVEVKEINHISHTYLPSIGGVQFYVYNLTELQKEDYLIKIWTTCYNSGINRRNLNSQSRKGPNKIIYRAKNEFTIFRNPIAFSYLSSKYLSSNSTTKINHFHILETYTTILGLILRNKDKNIVTIHGIIDEKLESGLFPILWKILSKTIIPFLIKNTNSFVLLTKSQAEKFSKLYRINKDKITIIPNGINFEESHNELCRNLVEPQLKILFVGSFIKRKNPQIVIELTNILKNEFRLSPKVTLIGKGPMTNKLTNLITENNLKENITIKSGISKEELNSEFFSASFLILPSSLEGFPTVILEAWCKHTLVICSDIPTHEEIINDKFGVCVPNKPINYANEIVKLIKDQKKYNQILKNACINAKKFDWSIIKLRYSALYSKILN